MTVRHIQALRLTTARYQVSVCLYVCMHACKAMVHCRLRPLPAPLERWTRLVSASIVG